MRGSSSRESRPMPSELPLAATGSDPEELARELLPLLRIPEAVSRRTR